MIGGLLGIGIEERREERKEKLLFLEFWVVWWVEGGGREGDIDNDNGSERETKKKMEVMLK